MPANMSYSRLENLFSGQNLMSPEMQKPMARLNPMLEDKHAFWSHMP